MTLSGNKPLSILTLDGGGVRGLNSLEVLKEIEKRTNSKIANLFDVTGGTSTGGLTTLALNAPISETNRTPKYTANSIINLYETEAPKIFYRDWFYAGKTIFNSRLPKYPSEGITSVANKYFGDLKFSDCLTETVIPSKEISEDKNWIFTRHKARNDPSLKSLKMEQILRATTAAPTYFPAELIKLNNKKSNKIKEYGFIDGGVIANNPTVETYSVAKKLFQKPENCIIISIGTGKNLTKLNPKAAQYYGLFDWIYGSRIFNVMLDSVSQATHNEMKRFFPQKGCFQKYYRFNIDIDSKHSSLDDTSQENMNYLKECGKEMVEKYDDQLREVCNKLIKISESQS